MTSNWFFKFGSIIVGMLLTLDIWGAPAKPPPPPNLPNVGGPEDKDVDATNNPDGTEGKIKIRRRRPVDEERYTRVKKAKKGRNIFGLGLIGFSGVMNSQSLTGATQAGRLTDSYSGLGLGAMFDVNLAGGTLNSLGIRRSGKWYWRWGLHVNFDYTQKEETLGANQVETLTDLHMMTVVKYYFPFEEYSFSRKIPVINRIQAFIGIGPKWTVNIKDEIENTSTKELREGPNVNDSYFSLALGLSVRISEDTYLHYDLAHSINMSPEIQDLTGKDIPDAGTDGTDFIMHLGVAYRMQ